MQIVCLDCSRFYCSLFTLILPQPHISSVIGQVWHVAESLTRLPMGNKAAYRRDMLEVKFGQCPDLFLFLHRNFARSKIHTENSLIC